MEYSSSIPGSGSSDRMGLLGVRVRVNAFWAQQREKLQQADRFRTYTASFLDELTRGNRLRPSQLQLRIVEDCGPRSPLLPPNSRNTRFGA